MRSFCFTILTRWLKIICDCWLKCKMCSHCTIFSSKSHFDDWSKRIWRIFSFERRFISVFSIGGKSLGSSFIGQKASRSITRVKRIYWTFFYRMCSMGMHGEQNRITSDHGIRLNRQLKMRKEHRRPQSYSVKVCTRTENPSSPEWLVRY